MSFIYPTAGVATSTQIGEGVAIWDYSKIGEGCVIGNKVIIGRGVYVGNRIHIGNNSKIQNLALLYEPAILEAGVFIRPGVIFTNYKFPRVVNPEGSQKNSDYWKAVGVKVHKGASIGAGNICVTPVEIGAWALVASRSTVVRNVPTFALVAGTPAKRIKWVGKAGVPLLIEKDGYFLCPKTGSRYLECDTDILKEVD